MFHTALYQIFRAFSVVVNIWFNCIQSSRTTSSVQSKGEPSESIPQSACDTWEELYRDECLTLKAGLEIQVQILRDDPEDQGAERIKNVCKELILLSRQADQVREIAYEMANVTSDSVNTHGAPREYFSSRFGDSQLEKMCISMEYSLDRMAFELRSDPSVDLMVAEHLEQMKVGIEMDFL